jgi:hypothetical protein
MDAPDESTVPPAIAAVVEPSGATNGQIVASILTEEPAAGSCTNSDAIALEYERQRRRLIALMTFASGNEVAHIFTRLEDIVNRFEGQPVTHIGSREDIGNIGSLTAGAVKMGGMAATGPSTGNGDGRMHSISDGDEKPESDPAPDLSSSERCVTELARLSALPLNVLDTRERLHRTLMETRLLISSTEESHRSFGRAGGCEILADFIPKCPRLYASLWEELLGTIKSICRFDETHAITKRHVTVFVPYRQGTGIYSIRYNERDFEI